MTEHFFRGLPEGLVLSSVVPLRKAELFRSQQTWRERFAAAVHEETGGWTYRGYDWHAFSYGYVPCVEGAAALGAVQRYLGQEVLVVADAGSLQRTGGRGVLEACGPLGRVGDDWIIIGNDFSWSLSLTHESGLGPYFAEPAGDVLVR